MHQLIERLADPLCPGELEDRFEGGIEGDNDPVGRERQDHVPDAFDEHAVALLGLAPGLLGAVLLLPGALELERTEHGGAEPLKVVLEDVVRRAGLDVFRGRFLVEAAGHDDDRGVGTLLEGDSQGVRRGELR